MAAPPSYRYISALLIVGIGMLMHLKNRSFLVRIYKPNRAMLPNLPSLLFAISVLCIVTNFRPTWPHMQGFVPRLLLFMGELAFTLSANDIMMRFFWVPAVRFLIAFCSDSSDQIEYLIQELWVAAPAIEHWVLHDCFFVLRFLLAFGTFLFMAKVTNLWNSLWKHCLSFIYQLWRPNLNITEEVNFEKLDQHNLQHEFQYSNDSLAMQPHDEPATPRPVRESLRWPKSRRILRLDYEYEEESTCQIDSELKQKRTYDEFKINL